MSHWAELNEQNEVIRVIVGDDSMPNEGGDWIHENLGGRWVKTSFNTQLGQHETGGVPFRKNFGQIGFIYHENEDGFSPPQPFPSWTLNAETFYWDPPTPEPNDDNSYYWDETTKSWKIVN